MPLLHRAFVRLVQFVNPEIYVVLDATFLPTVFIRREQAAAYLDHLIKERRQFSARLITRHLW